MVGPWFKFTAFIDVNVLASQARGMSRDFLSRQSYPVLRRVNRQPLSGYSS